MLGSRSEASRQTCITSADDLEAVLVSLKCTIIFIEDEEAGLLEDVGYDWGENKYEPQHQEEWLQMLRNEACLFLFTFMLWPFDQEMQASCACLLTPASAQGVV